MLTYISGPVNSQGPLKHGWGLITLTSVTRAFTLTSHRSCFPDLPTMPHLTHHLPREKSGLCPWILGYNLQALGMSCPITTSSFTWWSWAAGQGGHSGHVVPAWALEGLGGQGQHLGGHLCLHDHVPNKSSWHHGSGEPTGWQHCVYCCWEPLALPRTPGRGRLAAPRLEFSLTECLFLPLTLIYILFAVIKHNHEFKALWVL